MRFRTPIKQARGLGSAHHGTGHWWAQRMTAVALVPLMLWFVVGIASNAGAGHAEATAWIGAPVNAVLLILLLSTAFYHGALGLQVIIEDYVADRAARTVAIMLVRFGAAVLAVSSVFAILRIALGG